MAKRVHLDVELPDDLFAVLRKEEIETKVKEALVMELLRDIGSPREKRLKYLA